MTASERKTVLESIRRSAEKNWNELRGFFAEAVSDLNPNEDFSPLTNPSLITVDWMEPLYNPPRQERKGDELTLAIKEILASGDGKAQRMLKASVDECLVHARAYVERRESKRTG